jgi:shikimate kinase
MYCVRCALLQAVAEEMKNSAMHLRQDVDELQKALRHAYEEEGESRDRLRECQATLTSRNKDLDIVATGLGELLNTAEMMVVRRIAMRGNVALQVDVCFLAYGLVYL